MNPETTSTPPEVDSMGDMLIDGHEATTSQSTEMEVVAPPFYPYRDYVPNPFEQLLAMLQEEGQAVSSEIDDKAEEDINMPVLDHDQQSIEVDPVEALKSAQGDLQEAKEKYAALEDKVKEIQKRLGQQQAEQDTLTSTTAGKQSKRSNAFFPVSSETKPFRRDGIEYCHYCGSDLWPIERKLAQEAKEEEERRVRLIAAYPKWMEKQKKKRERELKAKEEAEKAAKRQEKASSSS